MIYYSISKQSSWWGFYTNKDTHAYPTPHTLSDQIVRSNSCGCICWMQWIRVGSAFITALSLSLHSTSIVLNFCSLQVILLAVHTRVRSRFKYKHWAGRQGGPLGWMSHSRFEWWRWIYLCGLLGTDQSSWFSHIQANLAEFFVECFYSILK